MLITQGCTACLVQCSVSVPKERSPARCSLPWGRPAPSPAQSCDAHSVLLQQGACLVLLTGSSGCVTPTSCSQRWEAAQTGQLLALPFSCNSPREPFWMGSLCPSIPDAFPFALKWTGSIHAVSSQRRKQQQSLMQFSFLSVPFYVCPSVSLLFCSFCSLYLLSPLSLLTGAMSKRMRGVEKNSLT